MSKEKIFWKWFKENNSKYFYLNQIADANKKEQLLDELLNYLHNYCDKLFFEIGGIPNETQELIISAQGNKEYFDKVEKLVSEAPKIKEWEIIAFKPPMGSDFVTNYEGIELNPQEIWFLPLDNDSDPQMLGLRIYMDNYNPQDERNFLNASYQVLDTILGEKSNALDIQHVEVDKLPTDPEKEELIRLTELPKYISWKKSKLNS